jgi:hypothetical protein
MGRFCSERCIARIAASKVAVIVKYVTTGKLDPLPKVLGFNRNIAVDVLHLWGNIMLDSLSVLLLHSRILHWLFHCHPRISLFGFLFFSFHSFIIFSLFYNLLIALSHHKTATEAISLEFAYA